MTFNSLLQDKRVRLSDDSQMWSHIPLRAAIVTDARLDHPDSRAPETEAHLVLTDTLTPVVIPALRIQHRASEADSHLTTAHKHSQMHRRNTRCDV